MEIRNWQTFSDFHFVFVAFRKIFCFVKKLYLVRHAKSDWSFPGLPDIDRSLNKRGYTDAHQIGKHLKSIVGNSLVLISSPAIRAISTALIIAREIKYSEEKILIRPMLYEAEEEAYYECIHSIGNEYDEAFIFGHNPTISQVFSRLAKASNVDLPTCSVSILKNQAKEWGGLANSEFTVENQLFPKFLASEE